MKAVVCTAYGSPEVLLLQELPTPSPRAGEVLIKVHASTVTMGDCELRNLTLPVWTRIPMRLIMGYRKPRRLITGMEFSGVVEAVGDAVTDFQPGDAVFGSGGIRMGGNAEYKCQRASYGMAHKPEGVSHAQAATTVVGGLNALHFLRKARIRAGQKVLINGAGGSIGTYGVQLAKLYGAEVTAVDHPAKLNMLREIGADHVVDYTRESISASTQYIDGEKYDVVFDMLYQSSFSQIIELLKPDGCYLMANPLPGKMLKGLWHSRRSGQRVVFELAAERSEDLAHLARLIADGQIKPVIDREYPLEQTAEAHRYVEQGLKQGNVIIRVDQQFQPLSTDPKSSSEASA